MVMMRALYAVCLTYSTRTYCAAKPKSTAMATANGVRVRVRAQKATLRMCQGTAAGVSACLSSRPTAATLFTTLSLVTSMPFIRSMMSPRTFTLRSRSLCKLHRRPQASEQRSARAEIGRVGATDRHRQTAVYMYSLLTINAVRSLLRLMPCLSLFVE